MDKRTVVITGGNSGLGYQCAKNIALESKNYTVILACRNRDKARTAVENIQRETGNPNIYTISLDLSSVESIYGSMSIHWTQKVELFYAAFVNSSSFSCGVM